jgi:hypothetical protein
MVSMRFNQRELQVHHRIHALERQAERGLSAQMIEDTIHTGQRLLERTPGERGGDVWRFSKVINRRKVVVIGEVLGSRCHVISNWYA